MTSPVIPSPSMIPCNQSSRNSQLVYSSAMLRTAIVRNELISKPIMPIPSHKAAVSDTRERFSQSANRAGKPANSGKALVESDARISAALAKGKLRKSPRTVLKRRVSACFLITVSDSDQTANPNARAGMSRNKMGMPNFGFKLSARIEKPVSAMELYAMIRPR